jgi:poly-gamma-glutamate capsule biosynthesis protein CapA/YwtB (metallophosphatase superfamily)
MTTIVATGQLLLHGPLDLEAPGCERLRGFLATADVALGNLEATVETAGAWPTKTKTLHLASADALHSLHALGFGVVTHANNHAFDLGPPGIASTRKAAAEAGLAFAGSGGDLESASAPAVVTRGPRRVAVLALDLGPQPDIVYASSERAGIAPLRMKRTVMVPDAAFEAMCEVSRALGDDLRERSRSRMGYRQEALAFDQTEVFGASIVRGASVRAEWRAHPADAGALDAALQNSLRQADLLVVSLHSHHWDPDWSRTPAWLHDLACSMIDRGVHMVVGTGSPVLQPVSFHRGRPILGGLGNLIFHTRRSSTYDREGVDVWTGAACRATFDESGECNALEIMPVAVGRPDIGPRGLAVGPAALDRAAAGDVFDRLTARLDAGSKARVRLAV